MPAVKRRTLLQALPAATLFPASLWAASSPQQAKTGLHATRTIAKTALVGDPALGDPASQQDKANPKGSTVYELRVYHAAPGKLGELLARFRDHTIKIFDRHGLKSVAYWTPVDEPEKSNTLVYMLQHPSREEAAANWKSFQDDPEWKSVKEKSEASGKLTEKIDSTFLVLTDFSPPLR